MSDSLFVTGGTGFFGKALLKHWAEFGLPASSVTLLSRDPNAFMQSNAELLRPFGTRVRLVEGCVSKLDELDIESSFGLVLHAATDSTAGPSLSRREHFDQIVEGTASVLKFATSHGCKRFLMTSSGAVYGTQPEEIPFVSESYQGSAAVESPNSAYSIGKRTAEHLCFLEGEQHGFDVIIARCFAFVGEYLPLDAHFAIGNFLKDALDGRDISVKGNGSPMRSFMMQDDLAEWLTKLLVSGEFRGIYNVGSDEAVSILDLAYKVRDLLSPQSAVSVAGRVDLANPKNFYVPDVSKAKSIGLTLKYDLESAITATADRLRAVSDLPKIGGHSA